MVYQFQRIFPLVQHEVITNYYIEHYIGCSFKFLLKVGFEESIVNAPLARVQSKNTNNAKSEVRFTADS
jgi:hypothetical protein